MSINGKKTTQSNSYRTHEHVEKIFESIHQTTLTTTIHTYLSKLSIVSPPLLSLSTGVSNSVTGINSVWATAVKLQIMFDKTL